jgi:putative endonuclease
VRCPELSPLFLLRLPDKASSQPEHFPIAPCIVTPAQAWVKSSLEGAGFPLCGNDRCCLSLIWKPAAKLALAPRAFGMARRFPHHVIAARHVIPAQAGIHYDSQTMSRQYHVYILASKPNGTLYIGVTNNIARRVWQHKEALVEGFTKKYSVDRLVYCEAFARPQEAIQREKRLKKWNRAWKVRLIESTNPEWKDLYETVMHMP